MVEPNPRAATGVEARSMLTFPKFGHARDLAMPTDTCIFFHPFRAFARDDFRAPGVQSLNQGELL